MPAARSADDDEPSKTSLPSNVNDPVVNAPDSIEAPDNELSSTSLKSGGDDSFVDATGSVESESELELPASAENPDRKLCKSNSRRGPNGHVWAHSRQDIFSLSRRLWSISMIEVADREYPSEKLFSSTVHRHGREPPLEPEPEPRKMRMWPVLTVDGDMESLPDDLRDIRDPTVPKEIPESSWNRTPKLTQRIPPEMLPEILRVKDRKDRLGSGAENSKAGRLKYQRVYPRPDKSIDPDAPRTQASLEFPAECDVIGTGHHATVFRADITFEAPFRLVGSSGPPKVRLTAKITNDAKADRDMLEHEARLYPRFPDHLSEDWSGFIGVDSMAGEVWDYGPILPPCAVVPKFYGYYVPVPSEDAENTQVGRPFLLLEDCGKRIAPFHFDNDERSICISFAHRLFDEHDFIQGSYYERNLLVQPGPLTHPPHMRSKKTPSFRLIDFGRASIKADYGGSEWGWDDAFHDERQMVLDTVLGEVQTWKSGFEKWYCGVQEEWPSYYTDRVYCIPKSFWTGYGIMRAHREDEQRMWKSMLGGKGTRY